MFQTELGENTVQSNSKVAYKISKKKVLDLEKDYEGNNPGDLHFNFTRVDTGHLLLHFQSDKNRSFFGFRIR